MPDIAPAGARPIILVVEDEGALLTLLRYNLEKQGFRVEEAADGQEALLRVAEKSPTWCCWTGCCRSSRASRSAASSAAGRRPATCRSSW